MVVANSIVYITAFDASRVYLAAITDGKQLWRYQLLDLSSYIVALQVGGDAVYLATETAIYAVNARTGQALWQFHPEAPLRFSFNNDLVYADATLYFGTVEQVIALDAVSGKPRWSYRFSDNYQSAYSPFAPLLAAGSGLLYLFLTTSPYVAGPAVTALDARLGTVRWQIQELDATTLASFAAPLVGANGVLYRPLRSDVAALDAGTGSVLWTIPVGVPGQPRPIGMSLDAQRLYVTGGGWIQAFDLSTSHLVWSTKQLKGTAPSVGPVVSGGVVYVATRTTFTGYGHSLFGPPPRAPHWLYAFDAATGRLLRMLQDNDSSFEPDLLAADGTRLYVAGSRSFAAADATAQGKPDLYALGV
jgi:outer membrane protein assembly factor BamB